MNRQHIDRLICHATRIKGMTKMQIFWIIGRSSITTQSRVGQAGCFLVIAAFDEEF